MRHFYLRLLNLILWLADQVFRLDEVRIRFTEVIFTQIESNGLVIKGEIKMAELREGQQFTVSAALKTASGGVGKHQEGSEVWESSDPSVAVVEANSSNPLQAFVKGVNGSDNGVAVISFAADGDPDEADTRPIIGTLDVVVTQGEATVVELTAGPAEDAPQINPL
jgi:hypothetical protein